MSQLQTANCELGTADCRLPTTNCRLPNTTKRTSYARLPHLLFVALFITALNLSAQNPFIQHYTTSDGLPSNYITYIFQDSKKFIWLATPNGVVRYNGTTFTKFHMKDGLCHSSVLWIKEDAVGRIWFRTVGDFNFYSQNKIFSGKQYPVLNSIADSALYFFLDKDSTIYFYSPGYLKEWLIWELDAADRVTHYSIDLPEEYKSSTNPNKYLLGIRKSTTGEFLIWTFPDRVFKTRNLKEKLVTVPNKGEFVRFFPAEDQTTYIASHNFDSNNEIIYKFSNELLVDSIVVNLNSRDYIQWIFEDHNGMLWVATDDRGIFCMMNKKIVYHFEIDKPKSIIQDHEDNIWIGTENGLYKISPYFIFGKYYNTSLFQNRGIKVLSPNPEGGVWCSSGEKVYLLKNEEFFGLNLPGHRLVPNRIIGLKNNGLIISFGSLYSIFEGLKIDPVTKTMNYKNEYMAPSRLADIISNKDETEFYACYGPLILTFLPPEKKFLVIDTITISEAIAKLFFNEHNEMIANGRTKNFIIRNDSAFLCNELSSIEGKIIKKHIIINSTTDLFGTEDDSIYLMSQKKLVNLTSFFDYPLDETNIGVIYHEPTLYLSTFKNIYKCNNPLNSFENKPVNLQIIDINFRNIHAILSINDSLYIASGDGLTVISEAVIRKMKTRSPLPYLKSVQINDKESDLSNLEITLTGNNKIKFMFDAINYSSTPVFFSYILKGFDTSWTTGTNREIVYSNLPRGNYVFLVRANKPASPWSNPIEYRITIKAHFYQHTLFFVFISLLFTGLIALLIIRRKNIQIKLRELDNQLITLEQKALQSMMNPHFIFNSLGSIQTYLLEKKSNEAGLYLSRFARLIRQNLNAINAASINLEEEIDRLKNYLDLEKLRMENRFDYSIEMDEKVEEADVRIPSMIIQPFVENAIWHGISPLEEKGRIDIKFRMQDEKSVKVIIEDNGIGIKKSEAYSTKREKHLHLGMEMTRKRLELLGKKFFVKTAIEFFETYPGAVNPGTRVILVVPVGK